MAQTVTERVIYATRKGVMHISFAKFCPKFESDRVSQQDYSHERLN